MNMTPKEHEAECPKCRDPLIEIRYTSHEYAQVLAIIEDVDGTAQPNPDEVYLEDSIDSVLFCTACGYENTDAKVFIPKPEQRNLDFVTLPTDRDGSSYEETWEG